MFYQIGSLTHQRLFPVKQCFSRWDPDRISYSSAVVSGETLFLPIGPLFRRIGPSVSPDRISYSSAVVSGETLFLPIGPLFRRIGPRVSPDRISYSSAVVSGETVFLPIGPLFRRIGPRVSPDRIAHSPAVVSGETLFLPMGPRVSPDRIAHSPAVVSGETVFLPMGPRVSPSKTFSKTKRSYSNEPPCIYPAMFHGRVADQHRSHLSQVMSPNSSRPKRSSLKTSSREKLSLKGIFGRIRIKYRKDE